MKRILSLTLVLCLLAGAVGAMADSQYIFPASDRELLKWDDVIKWNNEALHIAFNEIWARYGYTFQPGGACDYWFSHQPWYQPGKYGSNENALAKASKLEWENYRLIKNVMEYKRQNKEANKGRGLPDVPVDYDKLSGFNYVNLRTGQTLAVYSAPSTASWRGANGRASVSTSGPVYAYAQENGWMMVMYETNASSNYVRVGWVNMRDLKGSKPALPEAGFFYTVMQLYETVNVTDDPVGMSTVTTIPAGTSVTYLYSFSSRMGLWDYIAFTMNGQEVRGFIKSGALSAENTGSLEQPGS